MKRIFSLVMGLILLLGLTACGQKSTAESSAPTWQEQYDLGVRYLSEGNYEEAIIAFTAAIEIDPKQAPAYVGRGDAYIGLGETAENLAAAQADYEYAVDIGGESVTEAVYLKLADVYVWFGDTEQAIKLLENCPFAFTESVQEALEDLAREDMEVLAPIESEDVSPDEVTGNDIQVLEIPPALLPDSTSETTETSAPTSSDTVTPAATQHEQETPPVAQQEPQQETLPEPEPEPENTAVEITMGGMTFFSDAENLNFGVRTVTDISPLAQCTNLKTLSVWSNDVSDISPLQNLITLTQLKLSGDKITDISPLRSLKNLETLELDSNDVSDISALGGLTKLTSLSLSHNTRITSFGALSNLTNLENLELVQTSISDISVLRGMSHLKSLYLTNCTGISDFSVLKELTSLEHLALRGSNISSEQLSELQEALPNCRFVL